MTSPQLEPSAHAPCTSTTLRASAGFGVCANACAARSVAESMLSATTNIFCSVFICRTPLSVIHIKCESRIQLSAVTRELCDGEVARRRMGLRDKRGASERDLPSPRLPGERVASAGQDSLPSSLALLLTLLLLLSLLLPLLLPLL